jgi:hypothetical protein
MITDTALSLRQHSIYAFETAVFSWASTILRSCGKFSMVCVASGMEVFDQTLNIDNQGAS